MRMFFDSTSISAIAVSVSRSSPVLCQVTATCVPSGETSNSGSTDISRFASGVRSIRFFPSGEYAITCVFAMLSFSCSQWSQCRTGWLRKCRALEPFLSRSLAVSRCLSWSTPSSTEASTISRSAFFANLKLSTPSGSSVSCCGSPPAAGNSQTCVRLSASSSGFTSFGSRFDRNASAPSRRKLGAVSLLSPRVNCVASLPSVGTFQMSDAYLAPSRSSRCTATASHAPSGDGAMADTRFSAMCCSTV